MRSLQLTTALVGLLLFRECAGAPTEPKGDDAGTAPKPGTHEGDPEVALVQPVAILMDNGDVVPLPVGLSAEEEQAMHTVEAAATPYGDPYGDYGMYGAYPPPQQYAYAPYGLESAPDGRHLTQRMYNGGAMAYGGGYGVQAAGPLPPYFPPILNRPVVNKPIVNKPVINKPVINKPIVNKPIINRPTIPRPFEPAYYTTQPIEPVPLPIIEQPIYRPPPIPANVQPLYDSRYYSGQRPYHPQLPENISCPRGMKCSAKSYYVGGTKPAYTKATIAPSRAPKYLKRSTYSAAKYQY